MMNPTLRTFARRRLHRARGARTTLPTLLCTAVAALLAGPLPGPGGRAELAAQQLAPDRFGAATLRPHAAVPVFAAVPAASGHRYTPAVHATAVRAPNAPLGRVLVGTILGGLIGAGIGGLTGAAIGSLDNRDGFISASAALGIVGLVVAYPAGSAVGARKAAGVDEAHHGFGRLVLASYGTALLGGLVASRIGQMYESEQSMTAWYMGGVAGFGTHLVLTSLVAQSMGSRPADPAEDAGERRESEGG